MTNQLIQEAAVQAAGQALRDAFDWGVTDFDEQARKALEAAAPHLKAQALEDAAAELDGKRLLTKPSHEYYPDWLRERATKLVSK